MPSREPRRPGEDLFDWLDRTTDPRALMHLVSGTRECCSRNKVGAVASTLAHSISDLSGKGHL